MQVGDIMFEINKIEMKNIQNVKCFLNELPDLKEIDDEILKNGYVLYEKNEIKGVISYTDSTNCALIRYFVFKRNIEEYYIKELYNLIEETIYQNEIEYIYTIVNQKDIYNFFKSIGFKIDKKETKKFYEEHKNPKFKDSKFMLKKINLNNNIYIN